MRTYTIIYQVGRGLPRMETIQAENIDNLRRRLCHNAPWPEIIVYPGNQVGKSMGVLTYYNGDSEYRFWGKYVKGKKKRVSYKTGKLLDGGEIDVRY